MSLEAGNVVLVTGATKGLGRAVAVMLVQRGMKVIGIARQADPSVWDEGVELYIGDVADVNKMKRLCEEVLLAHGRLDGMVLNAGVTVKKPIGEFDVDDYSRVFGVNVAANVFLTQWAMGENVKQLVYVSSLAGLFGSRGYGLYAASKHALEGFVKCLKKEWMGEVLVVRPYRLRTSFSDQNGVATSPASHKLPVEWYAQYMVAKMMGARWRAFFWGVKCWWWWGMRVVGF